ncbi:hypothetical protein [Antarctobacter jejuensis]|uniref:hypothetical protein n=1 Tax=Antarctobacter jejuensis TaxID=1439938 RepID=UPI003FD3BFFE
MSGLVNAGTLKRGTAESLVRGTSLMVYLVSWAAFGAVPSDAFAENVRVQIGFAFTDAILQTRPRELLEDSPVIVRLDRLNGGDGPGAAFSVWRDSPRPKGSISYGFEILSSQSVDFR